MNITTIASSSKGCAYVVNSGEWQLLIDFGIPLKRIREALNHDLSKIVGCLVSHEHGDHAKYLPQLEKETSIPIWCTEGTKMRYSINPADTLLNKSALNPIPGLWIIPVRLNHDVECFGFLINTKLKSLFYATDTADVKYNIPGLTHLMIEANHSFELMIESDRNNSVVKRTCETHLDIDSVVEFVKAHPDLEEIHLIHLSDAHSDAEMFKKMVQDVSGVPVYVAES